LAVQHQHFMVIIDLLRTPIGGQLSFQQGMGRTNRYVGPDQPQALRHAMVMAIDRQRRPA
jgi:hypothetical protein